MLNPDPPQTPEHGGIVTVLIHNYYYLQTVNTTRDCTLSFAEFAGWLPDLENLEIRPGGLGNLEKQVFFSGKP